MIDVDEIEREIDRLEHDQTTYRTLEKLSVLYAVRNNLQGNNDYSYASEPQPVAGASEFLQACYSSDITHVLTVMDEHMKAIEILYPKEYEKIIYRIKTPNYMYNEFEAK